MGLALAAMVQAIFSDLTSSATDGQLCFSTLRFNPYFKIIIMCFASLGYRFSVFFCADFCVALPDCHRLVMQKLQ